ncbi:MAG TPA: prepilin peptidase [Dongiaceae bacterium]|nr:prepilin peptidase [Dongiaceae bacterium]
MNQIVVYVALVLVGACFGSFAGATIWRLRARQLQADKAAKEPYDHKEYSRLKKLLGKKLNSDRSLCLHCGYELKWYDLIPLVSWVSLKGKCRACHHPIGWFEPLMELGMVAFFVLSYLLWPGGVHSGLEIAHFVLWLAAGVVMAMLFVYDLRWFLLPDVLTIILGAIGVAIVGVSAAETQEFWSTVLTAIGAVGVLGGLYAVLYAISKGKWVGFGDVVLGAALGLLLVDWQLAAVALFMANLMGCLIVIPLLASKKLKRNDHVPFGPLLIGGTVVAWFAGWSILQWYLGLIGF